MTKWLPVAICAALVPAAALAHPTDIAFGTRGECEAAYAASSKLDRERLVEMGMAPTKGAAQRTFNETFRCEYDEEEDAWYIVFLGFPQN
jgi:hypothetical protein